MNRNEQVGLMLAKLDDFKAKSVELLGLPPELDALTEVVLVPMGSFVGRITAMKEESPGKVIVTIESEAAVREKVARLRLAMKKGPDA